MTTQGSLTRLSCVSPLQRDNMNDQNLKAAERLFEPATPAPIISEYERERLALYTNRDSLAS
jgi:hypothetical protein